MRDWTARPSIDPAQDLAFMRAALAVGRTHQGQTWPNPAVGALVVKDGNVIGEGATAPGGRPHAEARALEQAGIGAVGATLYVTLEPCAHRSVRGGTPCVEHVILSGIRRVVSAIEDPNRHIAGLGHALLRSAGVAVTTDVGRDEAERDHRGHFLRVRNDRPMVTLKLAQTADGFCAPAQGGRLPISCADAMHQVHLLRATHDAIMVGVGTVLSDDPMLNVRLPGLEHRSPVRVVLDRRLDTPLASQLVQTAHDIPVWIIAGIAAPAAAELDLRAAGVEVMRVDTQADGRLDLAAALRLMAVRGITRVFSEGGPRVGEALACQRLADEVILSISDHPYGAMGMPAVRVGLRASLDNAAHFQLRRTERHGSDVFQIYVRTD